MKILQLQIDASNTIDACVDGEILDGVLNVNLNRSARESVVTIQFDLRFVDIKMVDKTLLWNGVSWIFPNGEAVIAEDGK